MIPARALFALSAAFVAAGLAFSIYAPTAVERLGGTFGEPGRSEAGARAAGTTQARLKTWSALHDWTTEDPWRNALGAGFGVNVMAVSGASIALLRTNDPDLRSPHNFLLTAWARLGLLGFAVVTLIFAVGLRLAAQVRKMPMTDIDLVAGLLLVSLPIAALTGVVLESPFGAIPYFWALGHLGSRVEWHRRSENLPQQTQCARPA
jgi:O-antigen ligase